MKSKLAIVSSALIISIVFASIYIIGQQTIRLSANMPQIQEAQDIATKLNNNTPPNDLVPSKQKIDIAHSSAGFIIIYDEAGKVVTGSGEIDGEIPTIPFGVLQNTPPNSYRAVTWQPRSDVRIASVEVKSDDYFVLAGRSLNEPEKLVDTIGKLTLIGYISSLVVLGIGWFSFTKLKN